MAAGELPHFLFARLSSSHDFAHSHDHLAEINRAHDEKTSKHDAYHINEPKTAAIIPAQIRERHGVTRQQRKNALLRI